MLLHFFSLASILRCDCVFMVLFIVFAVLLALVLIIVVVQLLAGVLFNWFVLFGWRDIVVWCVCMLFLFVYVVFCGGRCDLGGAFGYYVAVC